jgi:hypothetical protein
MTEVEEPLPILGNLAHFILTDEPHQGEDDIVIGSEGSVGLEDNPRQTVGLDIEQDFYPPPAAPLTIDDLHQQHNGKWCFLCRPTHLSNVATDTDALVTIQMQWGQIEILAFGDVRKRWIISRNNSNYFATPGLHLRLTEGELVVHVLCLSKHEFKAWLPGEEEPDVVYCTYLRAICGAFGLTLIAKKPWKKIGNTAKVFKSILNHFVVGTPLRSHERFHISAEGERLRPPPIDNAMANDVPDKPNDDDDEDDDEDGNEVHLDVEGRDSFPANELRKRQPDLKSGEFLLNRLQITFE